VILGSNARGTGFLQVYQMTKGNIDLVMQVGFEFADIIFETVLFVDRLKNVLHSNAVHLLQLPMKNDILQLVILMEELQCGI
jgi:hypothetical protein